MYIFLEPSEDPLSIATIIRNGIWCGKLDFTILIKTNGPKFSVERISVLIKFPECVNFLRLFRNIKSKIMDLNLRFIEVF